MSQKKTTNLATNENRLKEIDDARTALQEEEKQIRSDQARAASEQKQRTIAAALNSVEPTLQPLQAGFDQADAELAEAVSRIKELARARDAAAAQLANAVRRVRLSLSNAGADIEQINKTVARHESRPRAVALLTNQISFVKPYSDALQEIERRTHWFQVGETQSLVVIITRRTG
jgi:predicted  nucleic acid-binding Zn-ribbon protein